MEEIFYKLFSLLFDRCFFVSVLFFFFNLYKYDFNEVVKIFFYLLKILVICVVFGMQKCIYNILGLKNFWIYIQYI